MHGPPGKPQAEMTSLATSSAEAYDLQATHLTPLSERLYLLTVIVAPVHGRQAEVMWGQVEDVEAALRARAARVQGSVGRC